jgi:CRISPR-associated protein Cst1
MIPLSFTGHALIDVGAAGLCAFAKRARPEDLTAEDLDAAADFMVEHYYGGALKTYLSCVFMNASFVQRKEDADTTRTFIAQYLRAHRAPPHPAVKHLSCVFSGHPATSPLVRTHLPMFSGEDVMNFRPNGTTFVPAAGPQVVALMFLPLASRRAEGRLLAVHADDPALILRFARRYLEDNRRLLQLALPTARAPAHPGFDREQPMWDAGKKRYKFADVKGPRSLVVDDLTSLAREALPSDLRPCPTAVTAYLLSSVGTGPSLEIFQVPSGVVAFVAAAAGALTASAWKAVAARYWPVSGEDEGPAPGAPRKKKAAEKPIPGRAGWTRNPAFEELCAVFDAGFTDRAAAARWLRRHILGRMDGRNERTSYRDGSARSWALAELFLKEVLGMKEGRIQQIRAFADKLAGWISAKTDKKLYLALTFGKLSDVDRALRRAQRESAGGELLFGLAEYRDVWLHDDGDRWLVRDLVCIRLVERLHELGYFKEHPEDALETRDPEDTESALKEAGQ